MLLRPQRDISRNFKNENFCSDLCIQKPLEMFVGSGVFENAGSGVFQSSTVLNDNNWNKFHIRIDHKLSGENSSCLLPKTKY